MRFDLLLNYTDSNLQRKSEKSYESWAVGAAPTSRTSAEQVLVKIRMGVNSSLFQPSLAASQFTVSGAVTLPMRPLRLSRTTNFT